MNGLPKSFTVPESGTVMPIIMRMELVLPEPLGPSRPNMVPGSMVRRQAFDGDFGVIDLADILEFNDGHLRIVLV